jgi:hypothetical protein
MTGSAGVRNQSLIAFFQSVDALVHYTPHPRWGIHGLFAEILTAKKKNNKTLHFLAFSGFILLAT